MWDITPGKSASVYEPFPSILPYNALPILVTYAVSSPLSQRFADFSLMWIAGLGAFLGINTPSGQHAKPILTT